MSTRGIVGAISGEKIIGMYNHSDSYPSWMGVNMTEQVAHLLNKYTQSELHALVRNVRVVGEDDPVSDIDCADFQDFANEQVGQVIGSKPTENPSWYQLLRGMQGDIATALERGIIMDSMEFANDSLFCEWGWFINVDKMTLEVYKGFQNKPHKKGRFAHKDGITVQAGSDSYYPIALVAEIALMELGKVVWEYSEDEELEEPEDGKILLVEYMA